MKKSAKLPPGPGNWPLVTTATNLVGLAHDPFLYMRRLQKTYGSVVALSDLVKVVFIFDPEYNRQVLSNPKLFYSAGDTKESSPVQTPPNSALRRLSSGLNLLNGDAHSFQRRLMMPAFHKKRVESYRETMINLTEQRLAKWRPGETLDLLAEMRQLTLAVAVQTLLGLDPRHSGQEVRLLMEEWTGRLISLKNVVSLNLPGMPYHRLLQLSEQIESGFRAMLTAKRESGLDGNDVLTLLLQAHDDDGARLSDDQLIGEIATLFTAGHETTASALTWTLFLLEQHPEVLTDLLDELTGRLHGGPPGLEDLNHLPLLDAVIKESMRLLPPGIFFMRYTTAPTNLGPYQLPAKMNIIYSPAITHRHPTLYPQPDRFLPRRWETLDPSPYEYMPFSGGPRMCIGATFAMTELKIVLPIILQRYRLSIPSSARVDRSGIVISAPRQGLPVELHWPDRRLSKSFVRGNIHQAVVLV